VDLSADPGVRPPAGPLLPGPLGALEGLTEVRRCPLVPEIQLHLAPDTMALWERLEPQIESGALPPPFWATAWAGGLALARHVLDHPELVAGREVVDVGSGSGLVAIAAALAGAARVRAYDVDPVATAAVARNAQLNRVEVAAEVRDVRQLDAAAGTVVTAGDVFYSADIAAAMAPALSSVARAGALVLVGDPERPLLPTGLLVPLARYDVAVDPAVEAADTKSTLVALVAAEELGEGVV